MVSVRQKSLSIFVVLFLCNCHFGKSLSFYSSPYTGNLPDVMSSFISRGHEGVMMLAELVLSFPHHCIAPVSQTDSSGSAPRWSWNFVLWLFHCREHSDHLNDAWCWCCTLGHHTKESRWAHSAPEMMVELGSNRPHLQENTPETEAKHKLKTFLQHDYLLLSSNSSLCLRFTLWYHGCWFSSSFVLTAATQNQLCWNSKTKTLTLVSNISNNLQNKMLEIQVKFCDTT